MSVLEKILVWYYLNRQKRVLWYRDELAKSVVFTRTRKARQFVQAGVDQVEKFRAVLETFGFTDFHAVDIGAVSAAECPEYEVLRQLFPKMASQSHRAVLDSMQQLFGAADYTRAHHGVLVLPGKAGDPMPTSEDLRLAWLEFFFKCRRAAAIRTEAQRLAA